MELDEDANASSDLASGDCCRYCYMEATPSKPLFYPCHCAGSMRYVHQECLDRWLSHNDRPSCEVCGHKFLFKPIYKEDMPKHVPIKILVTGLAHTIFQALCDWFHYTLVAIAWLIVVPLSAYRIYKFIFNTYGVGSLLSLTGTLISPNNFLTDVFYGAFIVSASIAAFVALVWLREQIINGAAPEWMDLHFVGRRHVGVQGVGVGVNVNEPHNNNRRQQRQRRREAEQPVPAEAAVPPAAAERENQVDGNEQNNDSTPTGEDTTIIQQSEQHTLDNSSKLEAKLDSINISLTVRLEQMSDVSEQSTSSKQTDEKTVASESETAAEVPILSQNDASNSNAANVNNSLTIQEPVQSNTEAGNVSVLTESEKELDNALVETSDVEKSSQQSLEVKNTLLISSAIATSEEVPGPSKSSSVKQLVTEDISEEVTNRDSRSSSHTSTESNAASSILSRSEIEGGTSSSTSGRTTDDSAGPGTEDDEEGEVASSTDDGEGIENANLHNARERPEAAAPVEEPNQPEDENQAAGDIFEQAAEELTWDRMLGLDGSLVFLEHVFWVISLNGIFVFLFVYCPYNLGKAICFLCNVKDIMTNIEGFVFLVFGYIAIAFGSLVMYLGTAYFGKRQLSKIFGIMYITMKVVLLMLVEIGVFPLLAGVWIDICTLALFDVPWSQRAEGFTSTPITSIFIHWMVGMVFVFYYASFIITLREILRPGVLWFMRNFTDPEFNPVLEMIRLPILSHVRRFILSGTVFGTTCLLALFLPVITIKNVVPKFLPYQISLVTDAPVSELSMELLLLQVILPALLDQGHIQSAVKASILLWTKLVGSLLDLRSYLLGANDGPLLSFVIGDQTDPNNINNNNHHNPAPVPNQNNDNNNNANGGGLQAAHLALLQVNIPDEPQDYKRPSLFPLRIVGLILITMMTVYILSCVTLFFPTFIGRKLMSLWFGDLRVHELYTCAIGVYSCWALMRTVICIASWVSAGLTLFKEKIRKFCTTVTKLSVAAVFCFGLIPLLLGLFFDILVVMPLRLSPDQTPVFFLWQSWALGILHSKIFCAITLIGPNWWLKNVIERVGRNGVADLDVKFLLQKLVMPVVAVLLVLLSTPYCLAFVVIPVFSPDPLMQNLFYRRFYHTILLFTSVVLFFTIQIKQMRKLYIKIKNDRYLIGQRLQNYEREK
ncbi:E3 ubiquitin-protein ligase MARCHF6-like isoform X3 [Convolutriloba macropyga]|uniref:E3 ubiquitin-protein ligase MARCHF6-like isoform X3 n=1 Tax=Convolutriloba macropyga TaxID=536237 RepID=UPI003F51D8DA